MVSDKNMQSELPGHVFTVIPPNFNSPWVWGLVVAPVGFAVLAAGGAMYGLLGAKSPKLEVGNGTLKIHAGFYGRTIDLAILQLDKAKLVDLHFHKPLLPKKKQSGVGLPGLKAGWFRLQKFERALVFVTDKSRVVYIPTRENYSLMFSLEDGEKFLTCLRDEQAAME